MIASPRVKCDTFDIGILADTVNMQYLCAVTLYFFDI